MTYRINNIVAVVLVALIALALGAPAQATLTYSASSASPFTDGADIAQLNAAGFVGTGGAGGGNNENWIFNSTPAQGQTFTTGADPDGYTLSAVTIQRTDVTNAAGHTSFSVGQTDITYGLRVKEIVGTNLAGADLLNDTVTVTGVSPGGSADNLTNPARLDYTTFSGFSVPLAASTTYAFEIVSNPAIGWKLAAATQGSDPYAGGQAINSGAGGVFGTTSGLFATDDRVFHLDMTAIPEPGTLSLAALGLMGLSMVRRRRKRPARVVLR